MKSKNHSLLYITPFFPPFDIGGMEISLKLLAEAMANRGWNVQIATPGYGLKEVKREGSNPEIIYVPWKDDRRPSSLFSPSAIRRFSQALLRESIHPDLIDSYAWPQPAITLGKIWHVPVVISVRDATFISDMRSNVLPKRLAPHRYFLERFRVYGFSPRQVAYGAYGLWRNQSNWNALKSAQHITYASQALQNLFSDLPVPGTPVFSITGSNTKELPLVTIPERDTRLPLFVYAGRLGKGKGAQFLFETVTNLLKEGHQFQCAFVGQGELETTLKNSPYRHNILVLGRKSREETLAIMHQATATIIPSIIFEGFPRAAIESIAVGTPVIGTTVGGIPEAVRNCGILIKPGDHTALAEAIKVLTDDTKTYQKFKDACRNAANDFTPEAMCQHVEPIYTKLLHARTNQ